MEHRSDLDPTSASFVSTEYSTSPAKLKSLRIFPVYMYVIRVPRNTSGARFIGEPHGDTKWEDFISLEMAQLGDYNAYFSPFTSG